jgi:hypothetical protein
MAQASAPLLLLPSLLNPKLKLLLLVNPKLKHASCSQVSEDGSGIGAAIIAAVCF